MKIYPLKFKPIYKQRIWGGQELRGAFDKDIPANENIGESWELADLPEDKSVITNGPLAGKTIADVLAQYPAEFTGNPDYQGPFSLLIKILDAQDDLSVQVHPDLDTCKKMGTGEPKTECWYIISKKPGACIYKGLKEGTTKEQFQNAIENGTCADYLEKIPVEVGECHFLPSGTCHAIGAGLLIAEIQQPSDTTYRVFDWNRVDKKSGQPRQLHVEQALESIHFDPSNDDLTVGNSGRLVDSEYFKVDKEHKLADQNYNISEGKLEVVIIIKGSGKITPSDQEIDNVAFGKGETIFIPAGFNGKMVFDEETEFLSVTI